MELVSTLLEILAVAVANSAGVLIPYRTVSTLLEILVIITPGGMAGIYRIAVSTLLEILGLACLVLAGF